MWTSPWDRGGGSSAVGELFAIPEALFQAYAIGFSFAFVESDSLHAVSCINGYFLYAAGVPLIKISFFFWVFLFFFFP
ncbi:hypothetical protein ACOSQ2_020738 [Xanthoceras sorbifolium]